MAIVIPEKIYIGYQERTWDEDKPIKLGFATYLEDNKAFEKRKVTIDGWSEPYEKERINEGDDDWNDITNHWYQERIIKRPDLEAEILDNDVRSGFKIFGEVRRSGWFGGNVLWRI